MHIIHTLDFVLSLVSLGIKNYKINCSFPKFQCVKYGIYLEVHYYIQTIDVEVKVSGFLFPNQMECD